MSRDVFIDNHMRAAYNSLVLLSGCGGCRGVWICDETMVRSMWGMPDGIRDLIGQQLQQYLVTAIIDIGGEYRYLRATDTTSQRSVMLVILPPKVFEKPDAFALLKEECFRIQSLKQTHLLPIYSVGMRGKLAYVAIPPIKESLTNFLAREKRIAPSRAVRTVTDLAWALQTLHSAGLIHGDIQPGNLLYDETGVLHLADFGIMRALDREQEHLSHGHGRGSTAPLALPSPYKAPELIGPRVELSVSGDIYSLGAVLHEMMTGDAPRNLQSNEKILLPEESGLDSQQHKALDTAIRRALAQEPSNRFPDARAFAVALRTVSGSKTLPPARGESLTDALAGVWHVSQKPATDASAQQLIVSLFSAEEPAKASKMPSRPIRRMAPPEDTAIAAGVFERIRLGKGPGRGRLIVIVAAFILVLISIVGILTAVNGSLLQKTPEAGTVTPIVTSTAPDSVSPSPTGKPTASPKATRSR